MVGCRSNWTFPDRKGPNTSTKMYQSCLHAFIPRNNLVTWHISAAGHIMGPGIANADILTSCFMVLRWNASSPCAHSLRRLLSEHLPQLNTPLSTVHCNEVPLLYFTVIYYCFQMFTNVYKCLQMFTNVYSIFAIHALLHMFLLCCPAEISAKFQED